MEALYPFLKHNFGPLFDEDDTPNGADQPTDNVETDAPQPEETEQQPQATDNADAYKPIDSADIERRRREAQLEDQLAQMQSKIDQLTQSRKDTAADAAQTTGGTIDDPFKGVTQEDLNSDPVLRAQYVAYQRDLQREKEFKAMHDEMRSLRKEVEDSRTARNQQAAAQNATQRSDAIVSRTVAYHPLFRDSKNAAHQHRLNRAKADMQAIAADLARRGVPQHRIDIEIEAQLDGYIKEVEAYVGMEAPPASRPPVTETAAEAANRRDDLARRSTSAPGATPPSRVTDSVVPEKRADIYHETKRRMEAIR